MIVNWANFKSFVDSRMLSVQWIDLDGNYYLKAFDGAFILDCVLNKSNINDELADFETNYKNEGNKRVNQTNSNRAILTDSSYHTGLPGSFTSTVNTHDFSDRTTWYQRSVQVTNETLVDSGDGLTFTSANPNWVDMDSPLLIYDYNLVPERDGSYSDRSARRAVVSVDGTQLNDITIPDTPGYTINFAAGSITFDSSQSGKTVVVSYWHNDNVDRRSEWILNPMPGYAYNVTYVELQFSKTINFSAPIHIEIWAGADVGTYDDFSQGLYDAGYGQNKSIYRGSRDFLNVCTNRSSQVIPAFADLTHDVLIFPFDYLLQFQLVSSQGTILMMCLEEDIPYTSTEIGTATFYTQLIPETSL